MVAQAPTPNNYKFTTHSAIKSETREQKKAFSEVGLQPQLTLVTKYHQ